MLTFRNTSILSGIAIAMLLTAHWIWGLSLHFIWIPLFLYTASLVYGSMVIAAGFYFRSFCSLATSEKLVALSFDDGPANAYTAEILDILKKENTEAAFFCIGNRIAGKEDLLKRMHQENHIIGNHSFSHHFWFDMFPAKKMQQELANMDQALEAAIGLKPRLFRPPYGVTNPNLSRAVSRGNYFSIGWSVRSFDTVIKDEQKLLSKIHASIHPGAIILFHDTSLVTCHMLARLLRDLRETGYQVVRLDKMLNLKPYA